MKMKNKSTLSLAAAVAVAGFTLTTPSANAAVISVADATASSFIPEPNTPVPDRGPLNLIDGAGIDGSGDQAVVNFRPNMWLSDNNDTAGWVQFDLGAVYTIDSFEVWNYYEGWNGSEQRSVNGVSIVYGTTTADMIAGTIDSSSTVPDITSFAIADTTDPYPGVVYTPASSFDARYIQFDISSTHGATFAGMADVQFEGTLVPEPATMSLLAMGGLGLLRRRRRRA